MIKVNLVMKAFVATAVVTTCAAGCTAGPESSSTTANVPMTGGGEPISFLAMDDHKVYGELYSDHKPDTKKCVLMFHQARSNAGEYETIAPKVKALGFDCIAIDQRSGGEMWGRHNQTADKSGSGDYVAAYNDTVGAMKYAQGRSYTTIVIWGSSYSAALALRLASENKDVSAVLVFSPGEYMDDQATVGRWAAGVNQPVFFACTPDEWSDGREKLFGQIVSTHKVSLSLAGGVHGSSTLIPEKSKVADQYMAKAIEFLKGIK